MSHMDFLSDSFIQMIQYQQLKLKFVVVQGDETV